MLEFVFVTKRSLSPAEFNELLSSAVDLSDFNFSHDTFVSAFVISQDGIEVSKDYNEVFLWNDVNKALRLRVKTFRLFF